MFLEESAQVIFHAVLVGSLYLLFVGHNQPGGGFVGGLVAGAAISLRYLAGGINEVRSISRFRPWTILGAGLCCSTVTAVVPMFVGDPVLESPSIEVDIPVIGHGQTGDGAAVRHRRVHGRHRSRAHGVRGLRRRPTARTSVADDRDAGCPRRRCSFSLGTYLVLQRKLSRIIIGLAFFSHGANVLMMISGRSGLAPLIGSGDPRDFSDPLPQALALTTIVITFGVTALLLALAYRSWLLTDDDEVEDDVERPRGRARGGCRRRRRSTTRPSRDHRRPTAEDER